MTTPSPADPPAFDIGFRDQFEQLVRWRRDVRRFRKAPVDWAVMHRLLAVANLAPSVGNSQPWRYVRVDDQHRRAAVAADFERCNRLAAGAYAGERARLYARLKLEGLRTAPVHLAVFCDEATGQGHGLGSRSMPETLRYSTVLSIHTLWLAARAHGLGVGWVSILQPDRMCAILDAPPDWAFVAYLCVGWPEAEDVVPELERELWEHRRAAAASPLQR